MSTEAAEPVSIAVLAQHQLCYLLAFCSESDAKPESIFYIKYDPVSPKSVIAVGAIKSDELCSAVTGDWEVLTDTETPQQVPLLSK